MDGIFPSRQQYRSEHEDSISTTGAIQYNRVLSATSEAKRLNVQWGMRSPRLPDNLVDTAERIGTLTMRDDIEI